MRGKVAKAIRKLVYGDRSLRQREYRRHPQRGSIHADPFRHDYQDAKKYYNSKESIFPRFKVKVS